MDRKEAAQNFASTIADAIEASGNTKREGKLYDQVASLDALRRGATGDEHVGFAKLVGELEAKGASSEAAHKEAASIGFAKYGVHGMEAKAHGGK
ncbi:MAG: hypothetical protein PHU06_06085 [Gallionella sp.]|nr:hypothetical protein [Gallionella sp.]MDD4958391.1 hypothetical protein [Gallionella sp.]